MKKFIFASIFLFGVFAIQNSFAACYNDYRYNGQLVRYCDGDHPDYGYNNISYYNGDSRYYDDDNNYVNDVYYEHYYDDYNDYNNNYYYEGITSNEENSIKIKYLNNLGGPGDTSSVKKDFFKTNVIGNDKELSTIDALKIKSVSFKSSLYNSKYSDAVKFFSALKDEIKTRYLEGKISYNQIYDIKNDLETLVYNLNNQFSYYKKYESSKSNTYKDMAEDSATQVRTGYNKLKFNLNSL